MSDSSHSARKSISEGRDYEIALNELIWEQKDVVAEAVQTGHAPLIEGCLASLRELEDFRREVLAGTALVPDEIRTSVDDLVRVRMDRHRMIREGTL